ncbi:DOMON domain-containing protein, partial [Salmonella sp. s51228]|uniref:DOMON domain-containing protein n=1 Tax=Salmonella sp. s51228 TaxID=3159652 RepID=UPI00397F8566
QRTPISIYWAFQPGPQLTADISSGTLASTTTVAPTLPVTTGVGVNCSVTKTCFGINIAGGVSTECQNFGSCDVFVSYRPVNDTIEFELQHIGSLNYMAVGISKDNQMGEDDVFYCQRSTANSAILNVSDSENPNARNPNVRDPDQSGINMLSYSISGNVLYCRFTRTMTPPDPNTGYELGQNNTFILLLAAGTATGDSGQITQHS